MGIKDMFDGIQRDLQRKVGGDRYRDDDYERRSYRDDDDYERRRYRDDDDDNERRSDRDDDDDDDD